MGAESHESLDAVIQGAGIAGLTLAIALQKCGRHVRVIERSATPSEVGAGIWMAPNAMQVFEELGIAKTIVKSGWPIRTIRLQDARGSDLQVTDLSRFTQEFKFETTAMHRVVLQRVLVEQLEADTIVFGTEIDAIEDASGEAFLLRTSSGGSLRAKVLVGADGIDSAIRKQLSLGGNRRYSGSSSYRAVARGPRLLPSGSEHEAREIWAKGCRLGFSQINSDHCYWYLTFDAPERERMNPAQRYAHAESLFRSSFPQWTSLLQHTATGELLRTDISELSRLRSWSRGRAGVIGDAAHASTPNLGQGGAMAVEDALTLAEVLDEHRFEETAWKAFEVRRRAKVDWTVSTSRSIGRLCHIRNPLVRAIRNTLFKAAPKKLQEKQIRKLYSLE